MKSISGISGCCTLIDWRAASGDRRAGLDDLAGALAVELHAELRRVGEHVVAAAVGDVDLDVAETGNVQRHIERLDERRHAVERHPLAAAVTTCGRDPDEPRRGLEHHVCLGLDHRDRCRSRATP